MRKAITLFLLLKLVSLSMAQPTSSPANIIDNLPREDWSEKEQGAILSNGEKWALRRMLPEGEEFEFKDADGDYVDFNPFALYSLDLDFDGDLDVLYSGFNGVSGSSTKIFYNVNNQFIYHSTLKLGIFDIRKNGKKYEVYTLFIPCCDSYTTQIKKYIFSKDQQAEFSESISIIGKTHFPYSGMPDFNTKNKGVIMNPSLYGFAKNIGLGFFGTRNKEIKEAFKKTAIIEMLKVSGEVKVNILSETAYEGNTYLLVITEPLDNLPLKPISLYEKSNSDNRRLVGWVKANEVK